MYRLWVWFILTYDFFFWLQDFVLFFLNGVYKKYFSRQREAAGSAQLVLLFSLFVFCVGTANKMVPLIFRMGLLS